MPPVAFREKKSSERGRDGSTGWRVPKMPRKPRGARDVTWASARPDHSDRVTAARMSEERDMGIVATYGTTTVSPGLRMMFCSSFLPSRTSL